VPTLNLITFVGDVPALADFYSRLGVEFEAGGGSDVHRNGQAPDGIAVDLDAVSFAPTWNAGHPGGARIVVGFGVDTREDVDRLFGELTAAGYQAQQEPWDAFWGARYAVIEDPDGNSVGLMSPIDPDRRTPPPM